MKSLFCCLLALLCFLNCSESKKVEFESDENEYLRKLLFFGEQLTNHFPKYSFIKNYSNTQAIDSNAYHNTVDFYLKIPKIDSKIDSILNDLSGKNIKKYDSIDSCLFVVNDYITKQNCGDPFVAEESSYNKNCSDKYPVPNFWGEELATNETKSKLPKDFTFYILDSKVGMYSKKIKEDQSSMPDNMKHGYSKGLAISKEKNTVIYWVVLW